MPSENPLVDFHSFERGALRGTSYSKALALFMRAGVIRSDRINTAQNLAQQGFAASTGLWRIFLNGRLYVQLKMCRLVRDTLPDGALQGGRRGLGRVHFPVEIN
ncbi:MAG: hypothetical protein HOQ10_05140 [Frateuria sp.]|uniref:hypothetical protein n=1 Tax=Frateuria sp. TaxID=2211372 RepID=UPI0017B4E877|nr:hypothetical protein [Frateuria sp.]NUO72083.1 hypothetical protein [Frateuria sp.]NUR23186.1 hypothetical protein [Frateuria sp.]